MQIRRGSAATRAFTIQATPDGDRRVKFIASTQSVDRHGTRLIPRGCDAAAFIKNPVFLWGHRNKDGEPDDVIGTVVDLQITDAAVVAVVEFDIGKKAQQCLRRVRRNVLRAVSVGFIPLEHSEPDADGVVTVSRWELCELSLVAVPSNRDALATRKFTVRAPYLQANRAAQAPKPDPRGHMEPKAIFEKLGITEGAKPEDIAAALIKYLAGSDADADKQAVVMGLLSMLAPAPSASSASDGGEAAAMEAMADEVRKLQARVVELEGAKVAAEKAAEPTPEQRADEAVKAGQWPMGQRDALVTCFKNKKPVHIFPAKTFSTRGVNYTAGGNPITAPATDGKPNLGNDKTVDLGDVDRTVLSIAKRAGLTLTPEQFAAAKAAKK